jgi:formylglycine-generating enzyme required for sulfatase activity
MTEVTQGQWKALMGGNPSYFKNAGRDAPVEQVSWDDALEFCHRLTERERLAGGLPEGYEYSLPTEAQWEFACRAGTTGDYAGDLAATAWYLNNSGNTTHRVAQKQANLWGLYDMHGNVWEWCKDWYGDYPVGSATDPTGPSLGTLRVYRGGGLYSNARDCRSPNRYGLAPGFRGLRLGFRVALAPQVSR